MFPKNLRSHHLAWLSAHPARSPQWLAEKLAEGFDVHHADGNHSNDDPDNLVLIECVDHMRLHNRGCLVDRLSEGRKASRNERHERAGRIAYEAMSRGDEWRAVEKAAGYQAATCIRLAKQHAAAQSLSWPPAA